LKAGNGHDTKEYSTNEIVELCLEELHKQSENIDPCREDNIMDDLASIGSNTPSKQNKCTFCNYESDFATNITRHVKAVHDLIVTSTGKVRFKCTHCSYQTNVVTNYKRHTKDVHGGDSRKGKIMKFKCSDCDHNYSSKNSLKRHIESHHKGLKRFECDCCGFSTSSKYSLHRQKRFYPYEEKTLSVRGVWAAIQPKM